MAHLDPNLVWKTVLAEGAPPTMVGVVTGCPSPNLPPYLCYNAADGIVARVNCQQRKGGHARSSAVAVLAGNFGPRDVVWRLKNSVRKTCRQNVVRHVANRILNRT